MMVLAIGSLHGHEVNPWTNLVVRNWYRTKEVGSYRCLALLDKCYGHQNHRIHFATEEHQKQDKDVISGGRNNLINNYTREEIEIKFILDCVLKVKIKGQQMLATSWQSAISSSSLEYLVKVKNISCLCFKARLEEFKPRYQPLMNLYGHSGTGDIKTVSPLLKTCFLATSCWTQLGLLHWKQESTLSKWL